MTSIVCPKCQHTQKLYASTLQKVQNYGRRVVRCSRCHTKIKIVPRKPDEVTD